MSMWMRYCCKKIHKQSYGMQAEDKGGSWGCLEQIEGYTVQSASSELLVVQATLDTQTAQSLSLESGDPLRSIRWDTDLEKVLDKGAPQAASPAEHTRWSHQPAQALEPSQIRNSAPVPTSVSSDELYDSDPEENAMLHRSLRSADSSNVRYASSAVLLFENLNIRCFGYFDPEHIVRDKMKQ